MDTRDTRSVSPATRSPASTRDQAAGYRRRARDVLAREGMRLTLTLAVILLLTVAMGLYMAATLVYAVGYLFVGEALWLDIVAYGVMGLAGIFLFLPLAASAYRLACLAVAGESCGDIRKILYPFTSRRAYQRCLAVGFEALGWGALIAGIPVGGFLALETLFDHMANRGVLASLCSLGTVIAFAVCLCFGLLMLLLAGYRMGFGYLVFLREELSLGEVNRLYRGFHRRPALAFTLRMSLTGWVALSVVTVLIPFVFHTIPYALCCRAVYGAEMETE